MPRRVFPSQNGGSVLEASFNRGVFIVFQDSGLIRALCRQGRIKEGARSCDKSCGSGGDLDLHPGRLNEWRLSIFFSCDKALDFRSSRQLRSHARITALLDALCRNRLLPSKSLAVDRLQNPWILASLSLTSILRRSRSRTPRAGDDSEKQSLLVLSCSGTDFGWALRWRELNA